MSEDEYDALVREHGATYAALEGAARTLRAWRAEHPDDDRDDMELIDAADGPFASPEWQADAEREGKVSRFAPNGEGVNGG